MSPGNGEHPPKDPRQLDGLDTYPVAQVEAFVERIDELEAENKALRARVAELESRCKRLEEAGGMLEWRIACGCGQGGPCRHCADTLEAWQQAKEAKP